jgi:hypothetical protein
MQRDFLSEKYKLQRKDGNYKFSSPKFSFLFQTVKKSIVKMNIDEDIVSGKKSYESQFPSLNNLATKA